MARSTLLNFQAAISGLDRRWQRSVLQFGGSLHDFDFLWSWCWDKNAYDPAGNVADQNRKEEAVPSNSQGWRETVAIILCVREKM